MADWETSRLVAVKDMRNKLHDQSGQAIAEFAIVLFVLVLILFGVLELGLILNAKLVLGSATREIARICAVEGGYSDRAVQRISSVIESTGLKEECVDMTVSPKQAIYGTDITIKMTYDYLVKSPVISSISGASIMLTTKAVTRSEFVPR